MATNIQRGNAHRLTVTLDRFAVDKRTVHLIAQSLHYLPEQLEQDMHDIRSYLFELEKKIEEYGENNEAPD